MGLSLLLILATAAFAAPPTYKVITKIKVGGGTRWDYCYLDSNSHRLYVSHGTQTEVIDTASDKIIGTIPGTTGVHGIAIADDLGKGFTSDGGDNDVTVFDLKTLKVLSKVKTGQNPDSIIYEPVTHRVFTFNGRSKDSTAIDAKTGEVITASIPVGGKPEFPKWMAKATYSRTSKTKTRSSKWTRKTRWSRSDTRLLRATAPAAHHRSQRSSLFRL